MIYCPDKYKVDYGDSSKQFFDLVGDLDDKTAKLSLIKFLRQNIGFTVELLSGIKLAAFQELALKGYFNRDFCMSVWGRGVSKSFTVAIFCFLQCIFEPSTRIVIAGPTFRTARNIFNELEKMVNNKDAVLLKQAFGCEPSRRTDLFEWKINGGEVRAIPLNADKIRGFRANILILDEYLLLSEHMVENVLTPFLVANKDITEKMKIIEQEDELVKLGALKEEDRTVFTNNTKLICLSSASYTFEHLYVKYKEWLSEIYSSEVSKNQVKYFVSTLSYEAIPEFMINRKVIEQASAGGTSEASFQREYCARFSDGSDSYFSAKKMKECTIEDGMEPTTLLVGKKGKKYLLAIDPSFSNSPSSDDFAMAVLELSDENPEQSTSVHNYAIPGGDLKDHIKYLYYILTNFNVVMIIIDNAGFNFIDSAVESDLFKRNNKHLEFFDFESDKEGVEYDNMIRTAKSQYNRESGKICFKQNFTSEFIRRANEHLQATIDRKRIIFASKIESQDNILQENLNREIDLDAVGFNEKDGKLLFINEQDNMINKIKSECALIEVKSSPMGGQTFNLPQHLLRDKSVNRCRRDSYTALMLGCWLVKAYNDINKSATVTVSQTFTPFLI